MNESSSSAATVLLLNHQKWLNQCYYLLERDSYKDILKKIFDEDIGGLKDPMNIGGTLPKNATIILSIEGKAGVGKSCFMVWFIVKLFSRARAYRCEHPDWKEDKLNTSLHSPKIVYTLREKEDCWLLELDNPPQCTDHSHVDCDFYLSDDVDVIGAANFPYKLIMATASNPKKLKQFHSRKTESGKRGITIQMPSLTYEECKKIMVDNPQSMLSLQAFEFRFQTVGGGTEDFFVLMILPLTCLLLMKICSTESIEPLKYSTEKNILSIKPTFRLMRKANWGNGLRVVLPIQTTTMIKKL